MEKKKRSVKAVVAAIICLLAVCGAGIGVYAYKNTDKESEQTSAYREYTAQKGNITVGTSESGTVSLNKSYLSLPVSAEVEEVYVKVGTKVAEGDKIAKLNVDDIDTLKAQYELKVQQAKQELDSANTDAEEQKIQAKQTYESSLEKSASAESGYNLTVAQLDSDISTAETDLAELKNQLAELESLSKSYPDDYAEMCAYDDKLEEYETAYDNAADVYSGYEKTLTQYEKERDSIQKEYDSYMQDISEKYTEIKTARENYQKADETLSETKEAYEKALNDYNINNSEDNAKTYNSALNAYNSAQTAYEKARAAYTDMYKSLELTYSRKIEAYEDKLEAADEKIDAFKETMEVYEEKRDEANEALNDFREDYDEFKADFNDTYDNMDADALADKISSTQRSISDGELKLQRLNSSLSSDTLAAKQQLESSVAAGQSAETVYAQALTRIETNLQEKQEEYDSALDEYNDFMENIGDGVYIYADCDGSVSEVNVSDGDTFMANQSIASIADKNEIYISVSVSEDDISALTVGQECSISLSAYENVTLDGEIDTIAVEPSRSSGSVSYAVTVKVTPNDKITVYSGMTAEVTFLQKQVENVLYVSTNAVTYKGNGKSAVLVYDENGAVVEKEVVTGFSDGRYVEIKEGLSAGDKVLAESAVKLS